MKTKEEIFTIMRTLIYVKLTPEQERYFLKELYHELKKYFAVDWTEKLSLPENDPANHKLSLKEDELLKRVTQ